MPSATGQNWEKYQKTYADDEEPEKKITPLTDEYATGYRLSFCQQRLSFRILNADRILGIFKS